MNPELQPGDEQMIGQARRLLDLSVAELDPPITSRLQRARASALEAKPVSQWRVLWASGLTMAGVAALTVLLWMAQPVQDRQPPIVFDDFELVLSAENVELAEDLEFYHWLADDEIT